jgi:hypothetical protein
MLTTEKEDVKYTKSETASLDILEPLFDSLATAIQAIHEAAEARRDRDYWRDQYMDLQNSSLKHTEYMSGLMLKAAIDGAFAPREKTDAKD